MEEWTQWNQRPDWEWSIQQGESTEDCGHKVQSATVGMYG